MTTLQMPADPSILGALCPAPPEGWLPELGCAMAANDVLTLGIAAAVLLAVFTVSILRTRAHTPGEHGAAFLVFPTRSEGVAAWAVRDRGPSSPDIGSRKPEPRGTPHPAATWQPPEGRPPHPERPREAPVAADTSPEHPEPRTVASERMTLTAEDRENAGRVDGSRWVEEGKVRFEEPPEGTLQLLPGRLELDAGHGRSREIRFVRVPGAQPEMTFGRAEGPPYRHVQLDSPTVSRLHARLRFDQGRWSIRNESRTNPTLLNGASLTSPEDVRTLEDRDRIEMGEVVFTFRQPEAGDRLPFRSSWFTDRGRRTTNQDAAAVRTLGDRRELGLVCDGMGAHTAGEVASHQAMDALVAHLETGGDLGDAVRAANRAVLDRAGESAETDGMGTTLVALLRDGGEYEVANVGDSRAYRIDGEGIEQITVDHSFVSEVVREGRMSEEEAVRSPWRNAVTRHVGAADELEVDLFGSFSAGDPHIVLLCSDGVHSVLPLDELERIVRSTPQIQDMARAIGEEALRRGSDDNVTAVVLQFGGGLPTG
ncbi:MAG: protein phosphatase 2C domain-containing protein [Gemmatimonadota bacterium]